MEELTVKLVKQLSEETGAKLMDCKRALTITHGDVEKAKNLINRKNDPGDSDFADEVE